MSEQAAGQETGKARVRRVLITPLIEGGMVQGAQTATKYAKMLANLERKLAHMAEQELVGMREYFIRAARGLRYDEWPNEQHMVNWAYRLYPPPGERSDYVASVMRSVMGQQARAEGYHVELFEAAENWGPPPLKYDLKKLKAQAQDRRGKQARIHREIARGVARQHDLKWLREYEAMGARCGQLCDRQAREVTS